MWSTDLEPMGTVKLGESLTANASLITQPFNRFFSLDPSDPFINTSLTDILLQVQRLNDADIATV